MKVVQRMGDVHEYWNTLHSDDPGSHVHGALFLVADLLLMVPEWARWKMVQPSGHVMLTEHLPKRTSNGWVTTGRQMSDCGIVEDGSLWEDSLELVRYSPCPTSAPTALYSAVRQLRKILPDDTKAITMEADGAIIAWKAMPTCMDGTWFGKAGEVGIVLGWHADPHQVNHRICTYVLQADGRLVSSSIMQ
jgi:hypothetical protein